MKKQKHILIIGLCLIINKSWTQSITANDSMQIENPSIEFKVGYGNSFLHNQVVILDNCPVCVRDNQRPIQIPKIEIGMNFPLNTKNGILIGLNYSQYGARYNSILPSGLVSKQTRRFQFISLLIGHRFTNYNHSNSQLFLNSSFVIDYNTFRSFYGFLYRLNLSICFSPGIEIKTSKNTTILFNIFFKESITHFNKTIYNKYYFPFSYGAELGVSKYFINKDSNIR